MTDIEFEKWRIELLSLDRYENPNDAKRFVQLSKSVINKLDARVIDILLSTFCNEDDYGIQEAVLLVLDSADSNIYADRMAKKFPDILRQSTNNEWPLILIGRIVNSESADRLNAILSAARNPSNPKALNTFIHSDYFLGEYPQVKPYLRHL